MLLNNPSSTGLLLVNLLYGAKKMCVPDTWHFLRVIIFQRCMSQNVFLQPPRLSNQHLGSERIEHSLLTHWWFPDPLMIGNRNWINSRAIGGYLRLVVLLGVVFVRNCAIMGSIFSHFVELLASFSNISWNYVYYFQTFCGVRVPFWIKSCNRGNAS